ncbi:MAG: CsgG/HfaB family protein, partial [Anaerolineales bacterium]|nr:CsgG/HfaB family protein [Anaerolineales bacterium]
MNYTKYRVKLYIILIIILNTERIASADTNDILLVSVSSENIPESVIPVVENRVIYSFSKTGLYTVIERREIAKIIKEQKFSLSGLIDDKTAIEAGKLIGADVSALVHMTFIDKLYYFDIKIIDNRTS